MTLPTANQLLAIRLSPERLERFHFLSAGQVSRFHLAEHEAIRPYAHNVSFAKAGSRSS